MYLGCLYLGVVTVPVNPALAPKEIQFILRHSRAKLLIVSPNTIDRVDLVSLDDPAPEVRCLNSESNGLSLPHDVEPWDLSAIPAGAALAPFEGVSPEDTMTIVYTSGTTASPSGVVHRISDMIDNARVFNHSLGIGPANRFYACLAMSYLGGYYNLLMLPYVGESSVVLTQAFGPQNALNFWDIPRNHGVNTLWLVPTIMSILMELDRGKDGATFCRERVHLALVGTAPLPLELRRRFEDRYGITLCENYALSETFFLTTNEPSLPIVDGSAGRKLPGIEVSIMDEGGKSLAQDQEGEVYVRTPYLMQGYYNPARGEPDLLPQGDWFPTGDIGFLSANCNPSTHSNLFITGRKKDLIIRGGVNISPAAIENVLYQHPAVAECAVVGIPHPHYGESVAAAVRLREGHEFKQVRADLIELCKVDLGEVRQPSHIVRIEEFPHSSSGKIQKAKLRELVVDQI